MLKTALKERCLPPLAPREEMLEILAREEYGRMPPRPDAVRFEVSENLIPHFCAGKATLHAVTAHAVLGEKEFSFPFHAVFPTEAGKHPFFVHINFRPDVPDRYMPTEELVDHGFAVLSLCYTDITSDDGDMTNGLAGVLFSNGIREEDSAGKLAMWAWAAQRVLDYAETAADRLDLGAACVCGHSRLGKTALLAGATDPRFYCAYSNDSGCSGAAVTRSKRGETVRDITKNFPYWFCGNYKKYIDREAEMPFDQHYLIAAIAPRLACVGSAEEDIWADPASEQLACLAASPAYEAQGVSGFLCENRYAVTGESFFDGRIGYHKRAGEHYFSRTDWLRLIAFLKKHMGE